MAPQSWSEVKRDLSSPTGLIVPKRLSPLPYPALIAISQHQKLRVLVVGASSPARQQPTGSPKRLRTGGQAIDIRTIGVTVMHKMPGMEAAVRATAAPITGLRFVDAYSRPVATIVPTSSPDQQSLVSEYEILRGDLAEILVNLTKANKNIRYIFGEQVASIEPHSPTTTTNDNSTTQTDDGPVTVTFTNNTLPPTEFDLVVAYDGSASRTRALGFACPIREHMHPTNWEIQTRPCRCPNYTLLRSGKPTAPPGALHRCWDGSHLMASFRAAQQQGEAALKAFVADQFSAAGWLCPALIAGMLSASPDFYATEIVQVNPPTLYSLARRVVLVGDAGYTAGPEQQLYKPLR
ncbi:hypothetical protein VTI74DRAFT_7310 [Chaetomium olivicolor]